MSSVTTGDVARFAISVAAIVDELGASLRTGSLIERRRLAADIVSALMDAPRSWSAVNPGVRLDAATAARAREATRLVNAGAPFAYAVGSAQFRHLTLSVDSRVLIPRPETEVLIDEVLSSMKNRFSDSERWGTAVDIGTGSGAIALALATEGRFDRVIATDISLDALDVARGNAGRLPPSLACAVEFRCGSLTSPIRDIRASAVVCNPPYIAFSEIAALPRSVRDWEPSLALLSGHTGMDATTKIIHEAASILLSGGILALEVDERRASLAAELMLSNGSYTNVAVRLDLSGRERFVLASRT